MSRSVEIDQSKMMREATLGFFVLIVLLGVLAFTIYAKATGLFTATPSADIRPAKLVELQSDGSFSEPKPSKPLLVDLPNHESNELVNLEDMSRISAAKLLGRETDESVRVATNQSTPALDAEILNAIPDRPSTEVPEIGKAEPIVNLESPEKVALAQSDTLGANLPPTSSSLTTLPNEPSAEADADLTSLPSPSITPPLQSPPGFYQKLSQSTEEKPESSETLEREKPSEALSDSQFPRLPNMLRPPAGMLPGAAAEVKQETASSGNEGASLISPIAVEDQAAQHAGFDEQIPDRLPQVPSLRQPETIADKLNRRNVEGGIAMEIESAGNTLNVEPKNEEPNQEANATASAQQLPPALTPTMPAALPQVSSAGHTQNSSPPVGSNREVSNNSEAFQIEVTGSEETLSESAAAESASAGSAANTAINPSLENEDLKDRLARAAAVYADEAKASQMDPSESIADSPVNPAAIPSNNSAVQDSAVQDPAVSQQQDPEQLASSVESDVVFTQEQIRSAMRMIELRTGENLSDLAIRVYGSAEWAQALFQLNRNRATSTGRFAVGTKILLLPKPMMEFLYPNLVPSEKTPGAANSDGHEISKIQYQEATQPPGNATYLIYQTRGGETLFGLAAEFLGQASRFSELLELNKETLAGRWGHLDPLPAGIKLQFPAE